MSDNALPTQASLLLRDWELVPFEECCTRVADNLDPSDCKGAPYLGLEHLQAGVPALLGVGNGSDISSAKTAFRGNDVLFGKLRPYLRKGLRVGFDGVCSTDIFALRAKPGTRPDFLGYLIHTEAFGRQAIRTTSGVNHPRTSWSGLRHFLVPRPRLDEQRRIAAVLSAVQRSIQVQNRLIALTRELRSTLMHKMFTEGTCGEPRKQTELGPVPQSWVLARLRDLLAIKHGYAFDGTHFRPQGDRILMTPGHVEENGGFRHQGERTKYYVGEVPLGYTLAPNDLMVAMTEQKAGLLGSAALVPAVGTYLHNQRLGLVTSLNDARLSKDFLYCFFNHSEVKARIASTATGSKVRHTSPRRILDLAIALPSLSEQELISKVLQGTVVKMNVHIALLQSWTQMFRTLLEALMTAKIRVHDLDVPALGEAALEPAEVT